MGERSFNIGWAILLWIINGESASLDISTMEEWAQWLSTIFDGFNENDVFNVDEKRV